MWIRKTVSFQRKLVAERSIWARKSMQLSLSPDKMKIYDKSMEATRHFHATIPKNTSTFGFCRQLCLLKRKMQ